MAVLLIPPYLQFYDANGNPLSGGKVYTYGAGSVNTPKATFTDNTEDFQAANPVILDSAGRATMWGAGSYKFVVYDADDNLVRTTDNVTTYTTADAEGDSFFQAFSGTGSQTAFTLSEDLGTDENAIMVFVADGLEQYVTNGSFATDTAWTKGAGWTIGAGVATATGAISTALSQTSAVTVLAGQSYNLIYTVTRSAGGIIPSIGGVNGTERTASGTYRETIIAGSTQALAFTGNAFTGTLDDISITPADAKGYDIQSPTSYTLNGTTLTFGTAPPSGTGNIYVFAPSLLVAAANAAAAAADASATLAAASATAADVSADAALVSELAAAATYDAFDDRYLGAKAADPTLDNDGNALLTGALYWNTVSNLMKAYDGAAWQVTYNPAASDMFKSTYDPANIAQQLVGTTATQTISGKTLTAPILANGGFIADANGNELLIGTTTASAVNEVTLANAATAGSPSLSATGGDTNITLTLNGKGTGGVAVKGVSTNTSAAAGYVGEYIESKIAIGSAVSLTTNVQANITSISLTAGDWDVWGNYATDTNAGTTVTITIGSINTTSATLGNPQDGGYTNYPGNFQNVVAGLSPKRISVASTTTVYLVGYSIFITNTQKMYGGLFARRVQ